MSVVCCVKISLILPNLDVLPPEDEPNSGNSLTFKFLPSANKSSRRSFGDLGCSTGLSEIVLGEGVS